MRSNRKIVTFRKPFMLPGLDCSQPAGDYAVVTDEEQIPDVMFVAWRRILTSMQIPSVDRDTGQQQMFAVSADDLASALAKDAAAG